LNCLNKLFYHLLVLAQLHLARNPFSNFLISLNRLAKSIKIKLVPFESNLQPIIIFVCANTSSIVEINVNV